MNQTELLPKMNLTEQILEANQTDLLPKMNKVEQPPKTKSIKEMEEYQSEEDISSASDAKSKSASYDDYVDFSREVSGVSDSD